VVLKPGIETLEPIRDDILDACRRALPPHKVPAMLTRVAALEVTESGKLLRRRA
jgi:acyl-coenzyme A synthetase/AMP-(fatty) acid ligase